MWKSTEDPKWTQRIRCSSMLLCGVQRGGIVDFVREMVLDFAPIVTVSSRMVCTTHTTPKVAGVSTHGEGKKNSRCGFSKEVPDHSTAINCVASYAKNSNWKLADLPFQNHLSKRQLPRDHRQSFRKMLSTNIRV